MFNFDTPYNRKGTGSIKWDTFPNADLLPMWIADMDFPAAPGIIEGLSKRLTDPVFGYGRFREEYYDAVISWMKRRHNFDIQKEWITFTPGVVIALTLAVESVSEPGDEILIASPVYGPFRGAVLNSNRVLVESVLKNDNGYYTFDFEDLESKITDKTKAFMLCSPHNPVGRVWSKEELSRICEICIKHNLYLISDEIHNDLVFTAHTVVNNISEQISQRCILCTAPSKTFNLAGIQASNIIIQNEELRNKFKSLLGNLHIGSPNAFVEAAVVGAYNNSEEWLDELIIYLKENINLFCAGIKSRVPKLKVWPSEGTYMVWVDCRELKMSEEELSKLFNETCALHFNEGSFFGEAGKGFFRVNLACPRSIVEEALTRLEKGVM